MNLNTTQSLESIHRIPVSAFTISYPCQILQMLYVR